MKLQILIPHYKEKAEVIRPLLNSIAMQQNIDFSDVGVIICHDGDEAKDFYEIDQAIIHDDYGLPYYPFLIKQIRIPHRGVSAARNACLDHAVADYVMFCDADDIFYNVCAFWILFREFESGFDSLISLFIEETRSPDRKRVEYVNHAQDSTFVHGKVHRRQYLIENKIRFNPKLKIHEDSYFNILAQSLTTNLKYCQTPFYLWRWRDESVCRHDPKYILKTYKNMIDSNDALVCNFLGRGMRDKAMFYTAFMVFDAYYCMNKPEWINQQNKSYRAKTEKRFAKYFEKHQDLWNAVSDADKMQISMQVRNRSVMEGMQMESVTIDEWLQNVKKIK